MALLVASATFGVGLAIVPVAPVPASAERGDITTYTDAAIDEPTAIAVGPDGIVWFTSHANDSIGRLDPSSGEITTFDASPHNIEGPNHLTVGPDGNVWFTNEDNDRIGRLDPTTGVVSTYADPAFRDPGALVAGPDGNIWFTASTTSAWPSPAWIGRVTTEGSITLFPLPDFRRALREVMVTGPDGRLWFIVDDFDYLGWHLAAFDLDTAVVSVYDVGYPGPSDISVGSDGNIWFLVSYLHSGGFHTDYLNHFSLDTLTVGALQPVIFDRGSAAAIAPGPDASVWFVNGGSDTYGTKARVGRLSMASGATTLWDDPAGAVVGAVDAAAAPDGSVWYAVPSLDRIARVDTAGPDVSITKARDEARVVAGHDIHYHLTITNSGTEPLNGVVVSDANAPACASDVGALAVGQAVTIDCVFTTSTSQSGGYTNVATVDTDQTDPIASNEVTTTVTRHPSVAVTLAADEAEVVNGETIRYHATIANTGDIPLTGVVTVASTAPDCDRPLANLAVGQQVTVDCERPTGEGDVGTLISTVSVDTTETSAVTSNQVAVQVGTQRSASVSQVADVTTVPAGDEITYHVTVTNTGDIPLRQVAEIDGPDSVQVVEIGSLVPGQAVTIDRSYPTSASDLGTFSNVATVIAHSVAPTSSDPIEVEVTIPPAGFTDVAPTAFYADAVDWAALFEVVPGVTDSAFRPSKTVNRARLVDALFRMMDHPVGSPRHPFDDVPRNAWFRRAVDWAVAQGLVSGARVNFRPGDAVSRADVVKLSWLMVGAPTGNPAHGYTDVPAGARYNAALKWAEANGLLDGFVSGPRFKPDRVVTRGQLADVLFRLASTEAAWPGGPDDPAPPSTVLF